MRKEAYKYFIAGLRRAIKEAGYLYEKDFAEGIMNPVSLSKNLTGKHKMTESNISACAKKLNKDVSEIVLMGKQVENTLSPDEKSSKHILGVQAGHIIPADFLGATVALVNQYQKLDDRMRFWRVVFDEFPVPALIIRDGVVAYQNMRSSAWGNITGEAICDSCACPDDCKEFRTCPIHRAMETRNPTSGYQHIGASFYRVNVSPVRLNDHEYFLVIATETREKGDTQERRHGVDRRSK